MVSVKPDKVLVDYASLFTVLNALIGPTQQVNDLYYEHYMATGVNHTFDDPISILLREMKEQTYD